MLLLLSLMRPRHLIWYEASNKLTISFITADHINGTEHDPGHRGFMRLGVDTYITNLAVQRLTQLLAFLPAQTSSLK